MAESGSGPPNADKPTRLSPSGPTAIPARMRKGTLGISSRSANTWAATPSPKMITTKDIKPGPELTGSPSVWTKLLPV